MFQSFEPLGNATYKREACTADLFKELLLLPRTTYGMTPCTETWKQQAQSPQPKNRRGIEGQWCRCHSVPDSRWQILCAFPRSGRCQLIFSDGGPFWAIHKIPDREQQYFRVSSFPGLSIWGLPLCCKALGLIYILQSLARETNGQSARP